MAALDRELDDRWRADRDYVIADMNGPDKVLLGRKLPETSRTDRWS